MPYKLTIIIFSILFSFVFSDKLIIKVAINLHDGPSITNDVIIYVLPGDEYEIIGQKIGWYKILCEYIDPGTRKAVTGTGFVYYKVIKDGIILGKGCTLRAEPRMKDSNGKSTVMGFVMPGAVDVIDTVASFYHIIRNITAKFKKGWIQNNAYYVYVKKE